MVVPPSNVSLSYSYPLTIQNNYGSLKKNVTVVFFRSDIYCLNLTEDKC